MEALIGRFSRLKVGPESAEPRSDSRRAQVFLNGGVLKAKLPSDEVVSLAGNGVSSALLIVHRDLSSAEILALDSAPVELVAGAAGFAYAFQTAFLVVRPGVTPYAGNYGGRVFVGPTYSGSGWGNGAVLNNCFNQASAAASYVNIVDDGDYEPLNLLDGQPLKFDVNLPVTAGDGTATLSVSYYKIAVT